MEQFTVYFLILLFNLQSISGFEESFAEFLQQDIMKKTLPL